MLKRTILPIIRYLFGLVIIRVTLNSVICRIKIAYYRLLQFNAYLRFPQLAAQQYQLWLACTLLAMLLSFPVLAEIGSLLCFLCFGYYLASKILIVWYLPSGLQWQLIVVSRFVIHIILDSVCSHAKVSCINLTRARVPAMPIS